MSRFRIQFIHTVVDSEGNHYFHTDVAYDGNSIQLMRALIQDGWIQLVTKKDIAAVPFHNILLIERIGDG